MKGVFQKHIRNGIQLTSQVMLSSFLFLSLACQPTNHNTYILPNPSPNKLAGGGGGGGTGDGGGGQGIFCTEETKNQDFKNKLFVRDIFEAKLSHKNLKSFSNDSSSEIVTNEALSILTDSLKKYFGPASYNLKFTENKFWLDLTKQIEFIDEDLSLQQTKDANSAILLPTGCSIVQIAIWADINGPDNKGILNVDKKLWIKLDQLNRVALLAHEYFYSQARLAGYTNSDFVRNQIGQLFSNEGLPPLFEQWEPSKDERTKDILPITKNGYKYCEGNSPEDTTAYLQYYQYEGKDKKQHIVIPYLKSKIINFSLLQNAHFTFDPKVEKDLAAATDLMNFYFHENSELSKVFNLDISTTENNNHTEKKQTELANLYLSGTGYLSGHFMPTDMAKIPTDLITNSGLLFNEYISDYHDKNNIQDSLISLTKELGSKPKTDIWVTYITTATSPIQLAVRNPIQNFKASVRTLKSVGDLNLLINKFIANRIVKLSSRMNWFKEDRILNIHSAISALHNELNDIIAKGQSIDNLPIWKNELQKLSLLITEDYLDESLFGISYTKNPDEFTKDPTLLEKLPRLLYQFKLNTYTEDDTYRILGREAFIFSDEGQTVSKLLSDNTIQVRQNSSNLNFKFKCNDYNSAFEKTLSQIMGNEIPKSISLKSDFNFIIKNDTFKNESGPKVAKLIFNILTEKSDFETERIRTRFCESSDENNSYLCNNYKLLLSDLKSAGRLEISSCSVYGKSLSELEFKDQSSNEVNEWKTCIILHFPYSNNSYATNFSAWLNAKVTTKLSKEEKKKWLNLELEFIRRIPNL